MYMCALLTEIDRLLDACRFKRKRKHGEQRERHVYMCCAYACTALLVDGRATRVDDRRTKKEEKDVGRMSRHTCMCACADDVNMAQARLGSRGSARHTDSHRESDTITAHGCPAAACRRICGILMVLESSPTRSSARETRMPTVRCIM